MRNTYFLLRNSWGYKYYPQLFQLYPGPASRRNVIERHFTKMPPRRKSLWTKYRGKILGAARKSLAAKRRGVYTKSRAWGKKSYIANDNVVSRYTALKPRFYTTLKYVEQVALNQATPVQAVQLWSANGLFDPNITGGGHQPLYFDQIMPLYTSFHVKSSKLTVKFTNTSAYPHIVALFLSAQPSAGAQILEVLEQPNVVWTVIGPLTGGHAEKTLTLSFDHARFFQAGKLAQSQYEGTNAANPSNQAYYCVLAQNMNSSVDTTITATAQIDYTSQFLELARTGPS